MNGGTADARGIERVGFIGLGSQGGPMARRIIGAGYRTVLWARRSAGTEAFAGTAATVVGSIAELAADSDLVGVCVLDDAGVTEVVGGRGGLLETMRPGGIVAVHSTVHPDTVVGLADRAAERGITVLDAPVSGGGPAAEAGRLLVMVGGEAAAVSRAQPVFATYGSPVVHLGPVGSGQRAKLLNNLVLAANIAVADSAFDLARGLGVEPAQLAQVLAHGSGGSFGAGLVGRGGAAALAGQVGPLLRKDARLLADLAAAAGLKPGTVLEAADAGLAALGCPR